jgi:hypothetical protein
MFAIVNQNIRIMKKLLLPFCFLLTAVAAYAHCGACGPDHSHDKAKAEKSCCGENGKCCKDKESCGMKKSCDKGQSWKGKSRIERPRL